MANKINIENYIQNFKQGIERLRNFTREGKVDYVKQLEVNIENAFSLTVTHPEFNIFHAEGLLDFVVKEKSDAAGKYRDKILDQILELKKKQSSTTIISSLPVTETMLLYDPKQPGC